MLKSHRIFQHRFVAGQAALQPCSSAHSFKHRPHLTMCRREAAVAQLDPLHAPDTGMLPFVVSMSI